MTTATVSMSTRVCLHAGVLFILLVAIFPSVSRAQSTTLIEIPPAKGLPVLFAPGWCGDSTDWAPILLRSGEFLNTNFNQLYPVTDYFYAYYNSDSDQVNFESSNGIPVIDSNILTNARFFGIKFRAPNVVTSSKSFDPLNVANTPVLVKADQLAHVIRTINAITGSQKSIVIGHSMGGLVARGYIEGLAAQPLVSASNRLTYQPGSTAYEYDVRAVITLDAPNDGALTASAEVPLIPSCLIGPSVTKDEMETDSPLIGVLNYHTSAELCVDQKSGKASSCQNGVTASLIDSDLPIRSIVSFVQDTLAPLGDGVLLTSEQNIKNALQKHYLEDGKFPKRFDSRSNVFAEFPNSDACTPIHDLGSGLHGLPCLASQQQTTTILLAAITSLGINRTPNISNIFPSQLFVGAPATLLTVSGQEFMPGATISVNGQPQPTQFISSTELTTTLASALFHTEQALNITVSNPQPSLSSNPKKLFVRRLKGALPIAGFTITSEGQSIIEGGTLSLKAQVGKPLSVTFSSDRSLSQSGSISAWQWKIDEATVSTANTFVMDLGLGTHSVSLVVMDTRGLTSLPATATITVSAAPLSPVAFFDGSLDPQQRLFFSSLMTPVIDSQNRLLVVSTHFGFSCPFNQCGLRTNAISPQGTLIWQSPNDGTFITHSSGGAPALGVNDVLFVPGFDTDIFAIDSNGMPVPGWPLPVFASGGNSALSGMIVDNNNGVLYAKAGQFFSFDSFPNRTVAVKQSDASLIWEKVYENGGPQVTIVKGPNGTIDSINVDRLGQTTFVSLMSGNEICSSPTVAAFNSFVGGQEGVFSSAFGTINSYDSNCAVSNIFTAPLGFVNLRAFDQGKMFGFDNQTGFSGLFAIATDGTLLWRDANVFAPTIQAIKNGVIYAWAIDTNDSDKMKLFLIDESSGTILQSMETSAFCNDCGFAIANDGTIYMADHNSTKIYKLN